MRIIPELAVRQPIVSGKTGVRWHMVMDPESLRRILKERVEYYPKSVVTKLILSPAIGNSLFIAEGAEWRWQRRAIAPAFASRNMMALGPVMSAAAEASCRRLEAVQGPVDMFEETVKATFEVISDVTFSGSGGMDSGMVHKAFEAYISKTARMSLLDVAGVPAWIPRPGRLFATAALKRMRAIADEAITARASRTDLRGTPDLLDLLLDAQDPETGRCMTREELRDNLLTFIVAGHETTALTLAWALYLCAFDPRVQERAAAEARGVLGGRVARPDDIPAMPYIARVVNETLRLYPPAAFLSRTALAADQLCG
ncbi:cytochrome P450, partial [Paracoccus sp. (in: a-proteobacteria)]|uniref:cytochrome P450 n=1 Tax=Paracoccus sp. TaxID=267 RepID=UPI003A884877